MITASFSGNCGNHMFQYAVTRSVAEHNGYSFGFNPRPDYDYYNHYPQLDFLNIDYGEKHDYTYLQTPIGIKNIWNEPMQTFYHVDQVNYHPFSPEIFGIEDCTKLVIPCGQDARYLNKEKVRDWFQIKPENIEQYENKLKENDVILDENTCVCNARGGEYRNIPNVLLRRKYWEDSIQIMKNKNPDMKFVFITDDVPYVANHLFQEYPIFHFGIGNDYYCINTAKNLILSNSSFAILPAWINKNDPYVIAPKWWARHNVSSGYWCSSDIFSFDFNFLDREGNLS